MIIRDERLPIELPTIGQVLALERKLKGERKEIFQESFDVLNDQKQKSDPVIAWKLDNLKHLLRGFRRVDAESSRKEARPAGMLRATLRHRGSEYDLGLVSVDMVTDDGVAFVIDALQSLATIDNLKWHGSGTNSTGELQGNSVLGAEVGSRVSGTQEEGASANIFKSVATLSYGSVYSIVEHGLFTASSSGVLFDRSVFASIGVDTNTSIEFTYEWTLNAGG